tara:strand:+ start:8766 stop:9617 length:852 start_codon:yes stop_codon:yes gene_type:complete
MTKLLKSLPLIFLTFLCSAAPQVATAQGVLQAFFSPGQVLTKEEPYYSDDGKYFVVHQADNNLVVYKTDGQAFIWGLNEQITNSQSVAKVEMGVNGQIVGFDSNGSIVWEPPGVVFIDNMELPAVEETTVQQTEIAQGLPAVISLVTPNTYRISTSSYNWIMEGQSGAENVGLMFDGTTLLVQEDGTFKVQGPFVNDPNQPTPVFASGKLELKGEEICAEGNLNGSYDIAGESLLDLSGTCFSYAKGTDYKNIVPAECITLSAQEKDTMIILCPPVAIEEDYR